jgi:hypothetical protein
MRFWKASVSTGDTFQKSNVESPEENGSAERAHQTLFREVRISLLGAHMGARWWPEGLLYAVAVENRLPTARLGKKSPYEELYQVKPDGAVVQPWGITCYAHIPKSIRTDPKLGNRGLEYKLLGLSDDHKGYRLNDIKNKEILIARDVKFGRSRRVGHPCLRSSRLGSRERSRVAATPQTWASSASCLES